MSRQTSNWIDRGDPVEATLARVLGAAFGIAIDDPRLIDPVQIICGQVHAAATEGDITAYVRSLFPIFARPMPELEMHRLLCFCRCRRGIRALGERRWCCSFVSSRGS